MDAKEELTRLKSGMVHSFLIGIYSIMGVV